MGQAQSPAPASRSAAAYNFAAIDYTRVVMALLVVAIHIAPLTSFSARANYYVQNYLARLGVPFFFFCNGYFLFRAGEDKVILKKHTLAQIKKLFEMYLMWTLLYMPIIVYQALKGKESPWKECLRFVRNFIFTASYGQLWYLPAAMLAIFLVWVCLEKCLSWRNILSVSGMLYAIGITYSSWYGLFRALPVWNVSFIYYPAKLLRHERHFSRQTHTRKIASIAAGKYQSCP